MPNQILQVDENMLETRLDRLVSEKVEQLLNAMLDAEADEITGAARYERSGERRAYRAGHYERNLTVKAGCLWSNKAVRCRHLFWTVMAFILDSVGGRHRCDMRAPVPLVS